MCVCVCVCYHIPQDKLSLVPAGASCGQQQLQIPHEQDPGHFMRVTERLLHESNITHEAQAFIISVHKHTHTHTHTCRTRPVRGSMIRIFLSLQAVANKLPSALKLKHSTSSECVFITHTGTSAESRRHTST